MFEVPVRFSSDAVSNRPGTFWSDSRFVRNERRGRPRASRSRRLLLYAALLIGFSALLAFVGCGSQTTIGELQATVSAVDFGAVTVGHASTATVSFLNSGTGTVKVSSVSITGQPFQLMGAGGFPVTIEAGSRYTFQVQFTPSAVGTVTGEATVISNVNAGGTPEVSLSGLGVPSATQPPPAAAGVLSGISCNNSSMIGAGTDNCFVALNAPAGPGGLTVNLSSSSNAVSVPATVTVPANTNGIGFSAKAAAVGSAVSAVLTAAEGGMSESFALELEAALRILSSSTSRVSFGYVAMNSTATQSVILTSSGTEPVTIDSASLTGGAFSIAGLTLPVALNPGQVIVMNVQFDPASTGNITGQLTITTNASSGQSTAIGLDGTGAVSPGSGGSSGGGSGGGGGSSPAPAVNGLTCASASMTGSGIDTCTVSLSSAAPAAGLAVALTSSSAAVTVPGSVTVPGGAVTAGFSVTAAAVSTAQTATLTATGGGSSQTFALQLNVASAILSASPSAVAFGNVSLNALGTQALTLTSTGTQAVTINTAVLAGTGFTMTGINPPLTLNPGQSITLILEFVPTLAGAASGQIAITSTATTGGSMMVGLSGNGAIPYEVNLTWDAPASSPDAVAGYNVYRTLSGTTTYQLLNSGVNAATTFTDSTVESGEAYVYYVTSVDGTGVESVPSNAFDVAIP
jgi:Abnormal spindle-like microcephaly-assoc'd, ASPM-SPD-2-Hydin